MKRTAVLLILVFSLAACATDKISVSSNRSAPAASITADEATTEPTLVTGRLIIQQSSETDAVGVENAAVYLEGFGDSSVSTAQAGTFQVTIPDAVFSSEAPALLAQTSVGWYALYTTGNVTYGVEQANVTLNQGQVNDLGDVQLFHTASVTGQVLSDGNALVDAEVTIPNTIFTATTGSDGRFSIPSVPSALWRLTTTKPGYATKSTDTFNVEIGKPFDIGVIELVPQ